MNDYEKLAALLAKTNKQSHRVCIKNTLLGLGHSGNVSQNDHAAIHALMRKIQRGFLLCLFCSMLIAADLPPDAQTAATKADKAVAAIRAEADAKVDKAQQAEIVALKRCQDAAMGKKDLDGATAIKAKIDELQKQVDDYHDAFAALAPPETPTPPLVGSWDVQFTSGRSKGALTINKDNSASFGGIEGVLKDDILTWSNGTEWKLVCKNGQWTTTASDGILTLHGIK